MTNRKRAKLISKLVPSKAAVRLKNFHKRNGDEQTTTLLWYLSNCTDDDWWLHMMYDAGEEIRKLY